MYRHSDTNLFRLLSLLAILLVIGSFVTTAVYHFYIPSFEYRMSAMALLVLALVFQIQIFILKTSIIERRLISLTESAHNRARGRSINWSNTAMVIFQCFFWLTLLAVVASFIPDEWLRRLPI